MKVRAVALVMVLLTVHQCGEPPGKDVGGDNNPRTGECTIAFEETVGGVHHRYPFLANRELRLVFGKVIFFCGVAPQTHRAMLKLQTRRTGAGQDWRLVKPDSMSRIPNPKDSLVVTGGCDPRTVAYWRLTVDVSGAAETPPARPSSSRTTTSPARSASTARERE